MGIVVEVNSDVSDAKRFHQWLALTIFSMVCLIATASAPYEAPDGAYGWVISVEVISMCLSFFACVAYILVRNQFESKAEMILAILLLLFWICGLPVIMGYGFAVNSAMTVINANLFFFSWAAFAVCVFLVADLILESGQADNLRRTSPRKAKYFCLCATSMIVLIVSSIIFNNNCGANAMFISASFCRKTAYGVSLGCISFVGTAVLIFFVHRGMKRKFESVADGLLLILWCFGVFFLTFGDAPGQGIGNLYFSMWISFILTIFLFGTSFAEAMSKQSAAEGEGEEIERGEDEGPAATSE